MTAHPKPGLFDYVARDAAGTRRRGRLSGAGPAEVTRKLRAEGLYPIEIAAASESPARARAGRKGGRGGPLNPKRQAELMTRLAKLTGGRVPLDRALGLMAAGGQGPVAGAAERMRRKMREGGSFRDALVSEAGLADPAALALVRGAELSGDLHAALAAAADLMDRRLAATRKLVTAMLYPALLLVVAVFALGLILTAIIPQFRPLVAERMDLVPFLGRMVFALSAGLTTLGPWLGAGALVGGLLAWLAHRRGRLGPAMRGLAAKLPGVGRIVARTQTVIALDVLAVLLRREVVLSAAFPVLIDTTAPGPVRDALSRASEAVNGGAPLSDALAAEAVAPPEAVEMIRIGEEAGDLGGMADRAAREMREAADRATERLLALFQPILIVIVGLLIGVSLYALFSAITAVNSIAL